MILKNLLILVSIIIFVGMAVFGVAFLHQLIGGLS